MPSADLTPRIRGPRPLTFSSFWRSLYRGLLKGSTVGEPEFFDVPGTAQGTLGSLVVQAEVESKWRQHDVIKIQGSKLEVP